MAFGIDFGTTNSVAASATGEQALPLVDERGLPHPSVVWYQPDGVVVGHKAKANINAFGDVVGNRFITSIKRSLGQQREFDILGERRAAYDVAAEIFKHLKTYRRGTRGEQVEEIQEAVLTIPIDFNGPARAELRRAARLAGIEPTTFVHEPFAAVVGFYHQQGHDLSTLPDQTLLVFDWGGGTLDVTVVRSYDGRLEELSTAALNGIAGDHFDGRVRSWAQRSFLDRNRLRSDALSLRAGTVDRLVAECERVKIALSKEQEETVYLANLIDINDRSYDLRERLARKEFDSLIHDDVESAMSRVDQALADARISEREIDAVLLIGGSSKIPLLQREMERRFGAAVLDASNAQTIIAEGAAVVAYERYQPFLAHPIRLMLSDRSSLPIFDRDTVMPATAKKDINLFCTDNRDGEARVIICEQANPIDERVLVQKTVVSVPVESRLPKPYQHERVYTSFEIDENLVLNVTAYGAAKNEVRRGSVHDLKFGLRLR